MYSHPVQVLGVAQDDDSLNYAALGFGGRLVVTFDEVLFNGTGYDVWVVETSPAGDERETARVSASQDGVTWFVLGEGTAFRNISRE